MLIRSRRSFHAPAWLAGRPRAVATLSVRSAVSSGVTTHVRLGSSRAFTALSSVASRPLTWPWTGDRRACSRRCSRRPPEGCPEVLRARGRVTPNRCRADPLGEQPVGHRTLRPRGRVLQDRLDLVADLGAGRAHLLDQVAELGAQRLADPGLQDGFEVRDQLLVGPLGDPGPRRIDVHEGQLVDPEQPDDLGDRTGSRRSVVLEGGRRSRPWSPAPGPRRSARRRSARASGPALAGRRGAR